MAKSNDPATWSSFGEATSACKSGHYSGIGFVFSDEDDILGVDLDKCRNPETGAIEPWAAEIVASLATYSEVSPSGRGIHLYLHGKLPPGNRRKGHVEVYDSGRYFTVTGEHIPTTPTTVEQRQDQFLRFYNQFFGSSAPQPSAPSSFGGAGLDDAAILAKAGNAKNGSKFRRLYAGDWSGYPSQSEADLALCTMLAFWCCGDAAQIDRLFRSSGLMRPDKWDRSVGQGRTYGETTVATAISRSSESYGSTTLPTIIVSNRPFKVVTADAVAALEAANRPPVIFVRAGVLCRVRNDEAGRPLIEQVTDAQLRHRMSHVAYFYKITERGPQHVPPPMATVEDVMAIGAWTFPSLQGIVEVPVMRRDGTVLLTPGYDSSTSLIYVPDPGLRLPEIPMSPSPDQLRWATEVIDELIGDFPFADAASKTNAVAALLTPIVRPIITGPTPLALLDAPKQGTGKGLLAECIAKVATGRSAAVMTAPDTEDEFRKRITATLIEGAMVVLLDNLEGKLESGTLSGALTSVIWKDRILGRSEMAVLPQLATWIATGNNIRLGKDMPRRCYLIRLDARCERPWEGREFRHPELSKWAADHRGELIAALLILARAWYAAGRPEYISPRLGSFEQWSRILGNILSHTGYRGFLANRKDLYSNNDADSGQWEAFFEAWEDAFGNRPVTIAETIREMAVNRELKDSIPDWLADGYYREPDKFRKQLGEALARQRDAQYGPWRLERAGENRRKVALWRVEVATGARAAA
jgi:hypothetical protein